MSRPCLPTVCILAGGLGSRLGERSAKTPKALAVVAGRAFVEHQLALLADHGARRAVLCVGHLGDQVVEAIGPQCHGVKIDYSFDGPGLDGTLGAIRRAAPLLGERFLVLYGDTYLRIDYGGFARAWLESGLLGAMAVLRNRGRWDRSNAVYEGERVIRYDKKKNDPSMEWIDYGLGALHEAALELVAEDEPDLAALQHELAARGQLFGFQATERFYEIGTPEALVETELFLSRQRPPASRTSLSEANNSGSSIDTLTTVVVCAYTMARWKSLTDAISAVLQQAGGDIEVVVVVDDHEMRQALEERWAEEPRVRTLLNSGHGIGDARNTGAREAGSDTVVFLDDDAVPEPGWLERILAPLGRHDVVAVGGRPVPVYAAPRPAWFPFEFDWVFGCHYLGMPEKLARIEHVIGTNMAMNRSDLLSVGGFQAGKLEDLDVSLRLAYRWPERSIIYEPAAVVEHHVPAERLTWSYFWRRSFSENRSKAQVHANAGDAASLRAERHHVFVALPRAWAANLQAVAKGDLSGLARIGASIVGLAAAGAGFLLGSWESRVTRVTVRTDQMGPDRDDRKQGVPGSQRSAP